ncbi:phosphatase PAP2 family protein [Jatrophihabitans sp. DSM 45814]
MTVIARPGGDCSEDESRSLGEDRPSAQVSTLDRTLPAGANPDSLLTDGPFQQKENRARLKEVTRFRRLAHRVVNGVLQLLCALALWTLYLLLVHNVSNDPVTGRRNGHDLLRIEQWLHIDIERWLQSGLLHSDLLGILASWEYALVYVVSTFGVLGLAWWRPGHDYPWARNVLAWTTMIAFLCFALYPVTPPRLLPGAGYLDIVTQHRPPFSWGNAKVSAAADQHAAMPSLHTAWGIWVLLVAVRVWRSRRAVVLAAVQLSITVWVIMATGNHYLLDAVGGAILVAVAVLVENRRKAAWTRMAPWIRTRLMRTPLHPVIRVLAERGCRPSR